MTKNWKIYSLGDLIEVKHGFAFKGEYFSDSPTKQILITPGNFKIGGGFKSDKLKYYNGDCPNGYALKEGDIIITMTDLSKAGDTLGYSAKVPLQNGLAYLHNQRIGLVDVKSNEVDREFIYWLLRTKNYQSYIVGSATGSTVKHTSPSRIKAFQFSAPPDKRIQRAITSILSSLDDKIELNLQMNQTLEAMAQAIFKEWFVNFNFPGFDGKLVNGLPKGWRKGIISDIYSTTSGGTPSRANDDYYRNGAIQWIKSKELNGGFILDTEESITEEAIRSSSAKRIPRHSLLVAMYGATVGEYAVTSSEATCNQAICAIIPNKDYPYSYVLEYLKINKSNIISQASGSAQQNISQALIQRQEILIPPPEIVKQFHDIVGSLFDKLENNLFINRTLIQLRDTLLPKLMTGKIEIKN